MKNKNLFFLMVLGSFFGSVSVRATCSAMQYNSNIDRCCYQVYRQGYLIDRVCQTICTSCIDPCGGGASPANDPRCSEPATQEPYTPIPLK